MRAHRQSAWDPLTRQCKRTEWQPFVKKDLEEKQQVRGSAQNLLPVVPGGLARLLWLFNDILYRGQLPPKLDDEGLAVLLLKARIPGDWSETRPITLSNILKVTAQLLLGRGLPMILPIGRLQHCKQDRQSVELIWALRRMARQAVEWREKFWIIKLDMRKAFNR